MDENNRLCVALNSSEIKEFMCWEKRHSMYSEMMSMSGMLMDKRILIRDDKAKAFTWITLVNRADYESGILTVMFAPEIFISIHAYTRHAT